MAIIGVIDPDITVLRVMQKLLTENQFQCRIFTNAADFFRKLPSDSIDLVLSEWELPDSTGIELCRNIRRKSTDLPVIFLANLHDPAVRLQALQSGALDYLAKPFDRRILLAKINAILSLTSRHAESEKHFSVSHDTNRLIALLQQQNIQDVIPVPNAQAPFGFSYEMNRFGVDESISQEDFLALLEDGVKNGLLTKKMYDLVNLCPYCNTAHLNVRMFCPECGAPFLTGGTKGSGKETSRCHICNTTISIGLTKVLCLSCGKEFELGASVKKTVYSYHLTQAAGQPGTSWLEKLAVEQDLQALPVSLFKPFFTVEKRQHEATQKPFALLRLQLAGVSAETVSAEQIKNSKHVLLIVNKVFGAEDIIFVQPPGSLLVFMPYTDLYEAEKKQKELRNFLERLELLSNVNLDLFTHDIEAALHFLEEDLSIDDQLP